jgi:hypothetical protein
VVAARRWRLDVRMADGYCWVLGELTDVRYSDGTCQRV